jgi:hypothetical protein
VLVLEVQAALMQAEMLATAARALLVMLVITEATLDCSAQVPGEPEALETPVAQQAAMPEAIVEIVDCWVPVAVRVDKAAPVDKAVKVAVEARVVLVAGY